MNANELLDLARKELSSPQDVSLDVWSAFATRTVDISSSLSAEHLSVFAWILYQAGIAHPSLWVSLTHEMTHKLPQFSNESLSLCLHVVGHMKISALNRDSSPDCFLVAVRRHFHRRDVSLNPIIVTSLIYAFSENQVKVPNFFKFLSYTVRATAILSEAAVVRLNALGVQGGAGLVIDSEAFDNDDFLTCALGLLKSKAELGDLGAIFDATLAYRIGEQGLLETLEGQSGAAEMLSLMASNASVPAPVASLAALWEKRDLMLKDGIIDAARQETGRHLESVTSRTACQLLHAAGHVYKATSSTTDASSPAKLSRPGASQILETDDLNAIFADTSSSSPRGSLFAPSRRGDSEALSLHARAALGLAEWAAVKLQETQAVPSVGDQLLVAALEGASLVNGAALGRGAPCVEELLGAAKFLSADFNLELVARTIVSVARIRHRQDATVNETLLRQLDNKLEIVLAPSKKRKAGRQMGEVCSLLGLGRAGEVTLALHELDVRPSAVLKVRLQELVAEEQRKIAAEQTVVLQRKQKEADRLTELRRADTVAAFGEDAFESEQQKEKKSNYLQVSAKQRKKLLALSSLGDSEDVFLPDVAPDSQQSVVDFKVDEKINRQATAFGDIPSSVSEKEDDLRLHSMLGHLTMSPQDDQLAAAKLRATASGAFSTDDALTLDSRRRRVTASQPNPAGELESAVGEPKFESSSHNSKTQPKRNTIADHIQRHREKQTKKDQALQSIKNKEKKEKEKEKLGIPKGMNASRHAYLTRHSTDKTGDKEKMDKVFGNTISNVK